MILIEENFQDLITEAAGDNPNDKKFFLQGVFAESETKNRNGRTYRLDEMKREVDKVNNAAAQGRHVLGELDHPNTLDVKLKNVSHRITKMWMEGNKAYGRAEILKNHPNGQIAIGLMKDGIQLGVSTRGAGKVNQRTHVVENFNLVTVDIVATPSARSAYPETIQEQLEMYSRGEIVTDLAEAVINDKAAQKYFEKEMKAFIDTLYRKK
jgi:hypothetical protein